MTPSCWKLLFWWCALVLGVKVYNFIFEYNNINIKFEVTWTTFIWLIMIFWLKFLCLISMIWFVVLLFFVHTSPTVWKFSTLSNHFFSRIFLRHLLTKVWSLYFLLLCLSFAMFWIHNVWPLKTLKICILWKMESFIESKKLFIVIRESYFFSDVVSLVKGIEFKWRATRIKFSI